MQGIALAGQRLPTRSDQANKICHSDRGRSSTGAVICEPVRLAGAANSSPSPPSPTPPPPPPPSPQPIWPTLQGARHIGHGNGVLWVAPYVCAQSRMQGSQNRCPQGLQQTQ